MINSRKSLKTTNGFYYFLRDGSQLPIQVIRRSITLPLPVAVLIADISQILAREVTKLCHYSIRVIPLLILFFIPSIAQTLAPILWFLFGAWMVEIQYYGYPLIQTLKLDKISYPSFI